MLGIRIVLYTKKKGHVWVMLGQFGTFLKHVEFLRGPRSNARSNLARFSVECTVESCEVLGRMHGPEREADRSAAGAVRPIQ